MDLVRRLVVRLLKGRDRGEFLVVLRASGREAVVCDRKHRSFEKPKRKSPVHLTAISTLLSLMSTDREIRYALWRFSQDS